MTLWGFFCELYEILFCKKHKALTDKELEERKKETIRDIVGKRFMTTAELEERRRRVLNHFGK